jgi:hypothetical protein
VLNEIFEIIMGYEPSSDEAINDYIGIRVCYGLLKMTLTYRGTTVTNTGNYVEIQQHGYPDKKCSIYERVLACVLTHNKRMRRK